MKYNKLVRDKIPQRIKNKEREIAGLMEALNKFKLKEGLIITFDQEEKIKSEGKIIRIIPAWKWLLEEKS